jgi:hypothetical protein
MQFWPKVFMLVCALAFMVPAQEVLCYSLSADRLDDPSAFLRLDVDGIARFTESVDPARLKSLRLLRCDFPNAKLASNARMLKMMADSAAGMGAADATERLVLVKHGA